MPSIVRQLALDHEVFVSEATTADQNVYAAESADGKQITYGCGKGAHARIGAFGECLEHLHVWLTAHDSKCWERVAKRSLFDGDIFVRVGTRFDSAKETVVTIPYVRPEVGDRVCLPMSLANVFYLELTNDFSKYEKFCSRYASSSGSAFGFTFEDALLHASLEIIERHEISTLWLTIAGLAKTTSYVRVENFEFHSEIEDVADRLRSGFEVDDLYCLVRKTDFGCYFSFATISVEVGNKRTRIWGAGCSKSRDLAIYRSMTECEQMTTGDLFSFSKKIEAFANRFPRLKDVSMLNIHNVDSRVESLDPMSGVEISPAQQLSELAENIQRTGRQLLYYDNSTNAADYSVISAYITDTEKFFNIMHGVPALPISHLRRYDSASRSSTANPFNSKSTPT